MRRKVLAVLVVLAVAAVIGYTSRENLRHLVVSKPKSQSEAATIHLAHLSSKLVTRDVVNALSPGFTINGDSALQKVAPTTGIFDEILSTKIDAKVTFELSPKGAQKPPDANGEPTSESSQATPQSPEKLTANADPFTAYSTANALHQEVAVLNNYIRNFPTRRGYRPYLVRLQLSVIPKRRNLPYDIYSDLIFFADLGPLNESYLDRRKRAEDEDLLTERKAVFAIPLLASENLERGIDTRSRALRNSLGLSGAGLLGTTSAGADVDAERLSKLQSLANDLNGLFTIGRVTDNVLRARFGAVQNAEPSYEMIPRTHNISLLLLIPEDAKTVEIEAKQSMRHAVTGEPLDRNQGSGAFIAKISDAVAPFKLKYDFSARELPQRGSKEDLCVFRHGLDDSERNRIDFETSKVVQFVRKRLRGDVAKGDFDTFLKRVRVCLQREKGHGYENLAAFEAVDRAHVLWTQIAQIQADLPDAFVSFEVPAGETPAANHLRNWTPPISEKPKPDEKAPAKQKSSNQ